MKRIITIKLTRKEADAIMTAGNRGIADMHDSQEGAQLEQADIADAVLNRIGGEYIKVWVPMEKAK